MALGLPTTTASVSTSLEMDGVGVESRLRDKFTSMVGLISMGPGLTSSSLMPSKSPQKGLSLELASAHSKSVVGGSKNSSALALGLPMTAASASTSLEMDRPGVRDELSLKSFIVRH